MGANSKAPISIAVYGLGKIAFDQHIPAIEASNDFQLAATISQSKAIPSIPSFSTLQELTDSLIEVDAIALCMPPHPRHQIAMKLIEADYDLLLEKPPCANLRESEAVFDAAQNAGVTIFASWHSKFAPMVNMAREWVDENGCDYFQVVWNENVLKWHPGQKWVSQSGGFGVLDPGVNALSIIDVVFDANFSFEEIIFHRPSNWETPIAASFQMRAQSDLVGEVNFDWLTSREDIWEIRFFSGSSKMVLSHGGHKMTVDDAPVGAELPQTGEYTALYNYFANLLRNKTSDFDTAPLRFVEQLYEGARWREVEAFNIA
jgi:D-galactose 1-dehydrogenase